ncbi:DNA gyrase inhibitor YacG [Agrobacterium larrymoorei]|uniref:DNA gyrase inhibitor YacG n=1 Tax=Agrobacterium larrymoorei TaxID=160699 RepID=A0AAF0HAN7_9HYPH|nr:DNA gyrase inhibitor YacG [Agrobacterium larrymoorei]WHA40806.1 DNA gyrase inhibitor YacG [Agrobacterium larrymoorei]
MTADSKVTPLRKAQPCPECKKPSTREDYPFCSDRCRSLDLARWLNGSYAIPVADDEQKADESPRRNSDSEDW